MNQKDSSAGPQSEEGRDSAISLKIRMGPESERTFRSTRAFVVGREAGCDLRIDHDSLSRRHAEFYVAGKTWWVRDLGSTNGTYVNGARTQVTPLEDGYEIQFAVDGPTVEVCLAGSQMSAAHPAASAVPRAGPAHSAGPAEMPTQAHPRVGDEHAQLRRAYRSALTRRSKSHMRAIGALTAVVILVSVFAGYQYFQLEQQKEETIALFYTVKSLELELNKLKESMEQTGMAQFAPQVTRLSSQLDGMRKQYARKAEKHRSRRTDREHELIVEIARIFGECDIDVPKDFVEEVRRYIAEWQNSERLSNAMSRVTKSGSLGIIVRELVSQELPPQFLYVALQESNFNPRAIGPPTYAGIAKGAWQIIPSTARDLDLRVGIEEEEPVYDPYDERFDLRRATNAAVRYLKSIYLGPAEGSGLLTMAAYNWGHNRIRKKLETLPEDPSARNFWAMLRQHEIPKETYDYVFLIVAAAVIGEDPRHFGFDFDPPLAAVRLSRSLAPWGRGLG